MKNTDKAQEICEKNKRFKVECSSMECYLSALEMAEWKDKEFRRVLLDIAIKFAKTAEDIKPLLNEFEELLKENHEK